MKKTILYAHKYSSGEYRHFYPDTKDFISWSGKRPIMKVEVVEDPNGDYWDWWHFENESFSMVYQNIDQFEMCFPRGSSIEAEKGRGLRLQVSVREVPAQSS